MIFSKKVLEGLSEGYLEVTNAAIAVPYIVKGDWFHCIRMITIYLC